jgi:hypothetical protein
MNLLKSGTLTWWQVGILKISLLSLGIAIGSTWPEIFKTHAYLLVSIAIALGLYLIPVWFSKKNGR